MAIETIEWVEPDGTAHMLTYTSTGKVSLKVGASGLFMPGFTHIEDRIPYMPGVRRRDTIVNPRTIDLPIFVEEVNEAALRVLIRQIENWFNPLKGDGKLRVTAPDGVQRQTVCRLVNEMQIQQSEETHGLNWQDIVISLRGFDPYWYDVYATNITYLAASATIAFFPGTPFRLSSSGIFSVPSPLINDGDIDTWPIWIIEGPGSDITITNTDTGEKIQFLSSVVLAGSESILIDTANRTVRKNDGTNLYSKLTNDSTLWPLYVGTNNIRLDFAATNANSKITVTFTRRYFSP